MKTKEGAWFQVENEVPVNFMTFPIYFSWILSYNMAVFPVQGSAIPPPP